MVCSYEHKKEPESYIFHESVHISNTVRMRGKHWVTMLSLSALGWNGITGGNFQKFPKN